MLDSSCLIFAVRGEQGVMRHDIAGHLSYKSEIVPVVLFPFHIDVTRIQGDAACKPVSPEEIFQYFIG
jgi:hypothetical protein